MKSLSHVQLFGVPWVVACQAPSSMGFSRQEYWSSLPFPLSGDLPSPGIKPRSPELQADSSPSELPGKPYKPTYKTKKRLTDIESRLVVAKEDGVGWKVLGVWD